MEDNTVVYVLRVAAEFHKRYGQPVLSGGEKLDRLELVDAVIHSGMDEGQSPHEIAQQLWELGIGV